MKAGESVANYEEAEKDYVAGMKYKDIAEKYGVKLDTVKSWKQRYGWIRGETHNNKKSAKKGVHTKSKKVCTQKTKEETTTYCDNEIEQVEDELFEKQRMFCVYFVKSHNATRSYMKAYECDYASAAVGANRLLKNDKIQKYISELREIQMQKIYIQEEDIVQKYADIAFADMNDYVEIVDGEIMIKDDFDGTIVQEITPTKDGGIKIKLNDRMKAMKELQELIVKKKEETEEEEQGVLLLAPVLEEEEENDGESDMEASTETN